MGGSRGSTSQILTPSGSCDECGGKGKVVKSTCPHCNGAKLTTAEETVDAIVERGVPDGFEIVSACLCIHVCCDVLRFLPILFLYLFIYYYFFLTLQTAILMGQKGIYTFSREKKEGVTLLWHFVSYLKSLCMLLDPSAQRLENEGVELAEHIPGDLVFRIRTEPHKKFTRRGHDLAHQMSISLLEALVGFKREIEHLDGHKVVVERTEVTPPGIWLSVLST